uniref:Uncharacterized protein n=1 Tax=viral metagenome TaxID=1070528 RepID=A0A6C0DPB4_9ZZZZ
MVSDTNTLSETHKSCSRCGETKPLDRIVKNRNVCKDCCNVRKKERYKEIATAATTTPDSATAVAEPNKSCNTCNQSKPLSSFIQARSICKDCNNEKRKNKYNANEEHRIKLIKQASEFKHKKVVERQEKKIEEIGEGNKKCSVCSTIKSSDNFRHNRLKCKDCEREDPLEKFKRNIRSRIFMALKRNKEFHTVKYLGCTSPEYLQWILTYDANYTLDNHGTVWHIDHVIPVSRFNLENVDEQMIAFNWRNTMPLSARENLVKNSKILQPQIEQHIKKLSDYHREKNIELPQQFIDLFAKHLVDGNPLKQSLPLQSGNSLEELG